MEVLASPMGLGPPSMLSRSQNHPYSTPMDVQGVSLPVLATPRARHRSDGDTNPTPRSRSSPPRIETQNVASSRRFTPWFQNILDEPPLTDIIWQREIEDLLDDIPESHLPMAWSHLSLLSDILGKFLSPDLVTREILILEALHLDEPEAEDYIGYRTNKQYCMDVLSFTLAGDSGTASAPIINSTDNGNTEASGGSNRSNASLHGHRRGNQDDREDGKARESPHSSWVKVQRSPPKHPAFEASLRIVVDVPPGNTTHAHSLPTSHRTQQEPQDSHRALGRRFQTTVLALKDNPPPTLYSPFNKVDPSEAHIVSLYHGTTKSKLKHFDNRGVRPAWHPNELSHAECFYATPSLAQAFVHPLYNKRRHTAGNDPIVVLRFDVDARVLHGLVDIPDTGSCASVKWYNASVEEERKQFISIATKNLKLSEDERLDEEEEVHDVTIAPICIPGRPPLPPTILKNWSNEQDGYLTQIGFTQKTWSYGRDCIKIIYEVRL
ncbi:hypothetical protein BT96DRAFT_395169 [Gymnopus androsaceus JB14]|uniref:Uncharacterized protein n=1 Tax=Gymnopus androsaceus JB14 TaxID=1447944 RepID=A0A6A4I5W7_9AGAR|nr:hypothetical protein BT96DRAFT_395169 [Gymnopus androsaceus JB14]